MNLLNKLKSCTKEARGEAILEDNTEIALVALKEEMEKAASLGYGSLTVILNESYDFRNIEELTSKEKYSTKRILEYLKKEGIKVRVDCELELGYTNFLLCWEKGNKVKSLGDLCSYIFLE